MNLQDEGFKEFLKQATEVLKSGLNIISQVQEHRKWKEQQSHKDWEVIEVKTKELEISYKLNPNTGKFCEGLTLDEMLKHGDKIHSVKRLSDGEVFTVGDRLRTGTIESLNIDAGSRSRITAWTKMNFAVNIQDWKKIQPLFKTADGVEIYTNERYWHISKSFHASEYISTDGGLYQPPYTDTAFSTEEAAKEYILLNKPQFSLSEIVSILNTKHFIGTNFLLDELKKLK